MFHRIFFLYFEVDGKTFFLKRETLRNLRERCLTTERMEKFDLNGPIDDSILSRVERNAGGILRPG